MSRIKLLILVSVTTVLLLVACGGNAGNQPASNSPVTVDVTLNEFSIESSVTDFKPGVPYHFVVKNAGQIPHELMILPVADSMGMSNMNMQEKDKLALLAIPQEKLPSGATVEMDYTFSNVPQGNIELVCMLPGHYESGMRRAISMMK